MRLKNKKTGEIKAFDEVMREAYKWNNYNSLAELNEEWCDYEKPKEYWYIYADKPQRADCGDILEEDFKAIGNYFETKEEAEKAVEKLKAWKRLKDKGFKFTAYQLQELNIKFFLDHGYTKMGDDLGLLFGGEE